MQLYDLGNIQFCSSLLAQTDIGPGHNHLFVIDVSAGLKIVPAQI